MSGTAQADLQQAARLYFCFKCKKTELQSAELVVLVHWKQFRNFASLHRYDRMHMGRF
jgi:hypothetical protein